MTKLQGKAAYVAATKGQALETDITKACEVYAEQGALLMHKVATPMLPIKRNANGTYVCKPIAKSTVDFEGMLPDGKFVAIEAKECAEQTYFPLDRVKEHQLEYLRRVTRMGGYAFLIVRFTAFGETYLMPYRHFQRWWDNKDKEGGRKSIPYSSFHYLIPEDDFLDFLYTFNELRNPFGVAA